MDAKKKCVILVIEPDNSVLDLLTLALEDEGLEVLGSRIHSLIVLESPAKKQVDLALVSFRGTGGPAIEVLTRIKSMYKIPVLALSCDHDIETKSKMNGFDGHISKPFDLKELYKTIHSYL